MPGVHTWSAGIYKIQQLLKRKIRRIRKIMKPKLEFWFCLMRAKKSQLQNVANILFKSVNQETPMFLKGIHSETWNTARLPSTAGILSLKSPND